jgi:hypothetical protein
MTDEGVQGPDITAAEVRMRLEGMEFVAEVPAGTRIALFRNYVVILRPGLPPCTVGDDGQLVDWAIESTPGSQT